VKKTRDERRDVKLEMPNLISIQTGAKLFQCELPERE